MRVALLFSALFTICGVAAALGYPAVYIAGEPVVGIKGLAFAAAIAVLCPAGVLIWRGVTRLRSHR